MSSGSNSDNGIGIAYTTNEEYPNRLSRNGIRSMTNANPVEYLEFVAAQEQYAPRNLSLYQDSLLLQQQQQQQQQRLPPPQQEQYIRLKQPSTNVHYIMSPDDIPQQILTNPNIKNNSYNPYFPPTEQQMQQFYNNKHISNPLPLSPLDEVVHSNPYPESYQVEIINDNNQQIYQQPLQHSYRQSRQSQQILPQQLPNNNNNNNNNNINNNNNNSKRNSSSKKKKKNNNNHHNHNRNYDETPRSPIDDHSAVTPSPLALPGLYLTRNRSRVSTPRIENLPSILNAYTAQVQQSDSPLRTHYDSDSSDSDSSKTKRFNILGEILNNDRLSNFKERTAIQDPNESLVKFDFRDANGDPDDPLLNNMNVPTQEEERQLPTGLLNGNINNSNINNNNAINIIPQQYSKDDSITSSISPISPTSQVTPIIKRTMIDKKEKDQNHDVIIIGPGKEIKIYKPKQGSIFMLLAIFSLAAMIFITWKLGDWGVGNAKDIYNFSTNNGVLYIYPPGTTKPPPI